MVCTTGCRVDAALMRMRWETSGSKPSILSLQLTCTGHQHRLQLPSFVGRKGQRRANVDTPRGLARGPLTYLLVKSHITPLLVPP